MPEIEIAGSRRIGTGHPCFIIAEAGVNHNGSLDLARQLVDAAADAGADAVKFQTWITEKLVAADAGMAEYQKENVGTGGTQFSMLKALELSPAAFREIQAYCAEKGILFLSTPDEEDSADFLESLGVPLFKIGSAELDNLPYLRHVARKDRPLILSTGMSSLDEVRAAVAAIRNAGNDQIGLLHCVSNYPAAARDCNLRAMATLAKEFGVVVGFSDHTLGIHVSLAAAALDACVIEKHLTLDKAMLGPDHLCSLDPHEFKALVNGVREIESALGSGAKQPTPGELETRKVVRKTFVAARALAPGDVLAERDLALRRTSGGLPVSALGAILGRRVKSAVAEGATLDLSVLE